MFVVFSMAQCEVDQSINMISKANKNDGNHRPVAEIASWVPAAPLPIRYPSENEFQPSTRGSKAFAASHAGANLSRKVKITGLVRSKKLVKGAVESDERETAMVRPAGGRLRRATKRVSGRRTPQPYLKPRCSKLVPKHLLGLPEREDERNPEPQQRPGHHHCRRLHLAAPYEEDVMRYLLEVESRHQPPAPHALSPHSRAVVIDWLIQIQSYLGQSQETLYQSVGLMDRALPRLRLPLHQAQLLAITAFLIASKLEGKFPVEISELLQLTLNTYTRDQLLSLERGVLVALEFSLAYSDPTVFLDFFLHLSGHGGDSLVMACCGFLLDVVLVEVWPSRTRPSLLALAALYGALAILHGLSIATRLPTLAPPYFRLDEAAVVATSLRMVETLTNRRSLPFQAAEAKYCSSLRHRHLALHPHLAPHHLSRVAQHVHASLVALRAGVVQEASTKRRRPAEERDDDDDLPSLKHSNRGETTN